MSLFLCDTCHQSYEDYYPPDDSCMLCKKGLVRIVENEPKKLSLSQIENMFLDDFNPRLD